MATLVAILVGVPVWLSYLSNREKKRDLNQRLAQFRRELAVELRRRRKAQGLSIEDFARAVSPGTTSDQITTWESTGEVPHESMGRVLDLLEVPEWDYRALALTRLSSEEFTSQVEPSSQRGTSDEALVSARRTWCLASRYSSIIIPVVAARSESKSQFRTALSHNYTYVDNLSDRDSLLEVVRLLSRLYPFSDVSLESADGYPASLQSRPSVVIGGIGLPGQPNNGFALEVFEALDIDLSYSDMALHFDGRTWPSQLKNGMLVKDAGMFARLRSPLDSDIQLIFLQGTHTRGVFGAAKAFSLSDKARVNHDLCRRLVGERDFLAIFDVAITGGEVTVPQLNESNFFVQ